MVLQTKPDLRLENHTLRHMLAKRMSVCICTDNRTFSNTTVTKEIQLAVSTFNISSRVLKDIVVGSFKR